MMKTCIMTSHAHRSEQESVISGCFVNYVHGFTAVAKAMSTYCHCRDFSCDVTDVEIPSGKPLWHYYFVCGLRGITERCDITNATTGMMAVVDGTIPRCAGLSSSSALVCCAALATMQIYGQRLTKVGDRH